MTETAQRLRPVARTDRYGNVVADWAGAGSALIAGCALAPRVAGEERGHGRQGVVVGWTLFAPPDADIAPTDRVVVRGRTYEVDGEPAVWTSPFAGAAGGVEIALRRVDG